MLSLKRPLLLLQALVASFTLVSSSFAEDVTLVGSLVQRLKETKPGLNTQPEKQIQLLQIELSEEQKSYLEEQAKALLTAKEPLSKTAVELESATLPKKIELGMNKVPVLDQGMHGTCVTFAITGALDALIGRGDYISQLCNLQLGSYLERQSAEPSGWDGSYPLRVINQISQYGIINTDKQYRYGCGGSTIYPVYGRRDKNSFMDTDQFGALSEAVIGKYANWSDQSLRHEPEKLLNLAKETLNSGDRLVFAVILPRTDLGTVGALGRHNTYLAYDTWLLTPEITSNLSKARAGHAMIITGYDDEAEAVDNSGKVHKGLFKLRNSWGYRVGDYGEFYMSYDYFKLLAFDLKRFYSVSI